MDVDIFLALFFGLDGEVEFVDEFLGGFGSGKVGGVGVFFLIDFGLR